MLSVQKPGTFPHEFQRGQVREPIAGRLDNIPRAYPSIIEHLSDERKSTGRIGHFSSRRPLLGVTADQEGSVPMPMPSCAPMFPAPMPPHLFNHPAEQLERADWNMVEQPLLTGTADHIQYHKRLHQDRGNYMRPVNADEIGERELTANPPHKGWPFRPMPTKRAPIENRIGFYDSVNKGNIARGGQGAAGGADWKEPNPRTRKGGDFVNNRGAPPKSSLVQTRTGIERDTRRSLFIEGDVSGNRTDVEQSNIIIDPRTFRAKDTNRVFRATVSGNAETVNQGPWRLDEGFVGDRRPTNKTADTHVSYGPDLTLQGMSADRFQTQRTHIFEHRAEIRSDPQTRIVNNQGPAHLFDRPPLRGRVDRVTQKDTLRNIGRADVGMTVEGLRDNPYYPGDEHHFYAKVQAQAQAVRG